MPSSAGGNLSAAIELLNSVLPEPKSIPTESTRFRVGCSPTSPLNNNLCRLPYREDVRSAIRSQIICLIHEFHLLKLSIAVYAHDDGRLVDILQIDGTAPMYHRGTKYNLPIRIFLLEDFPRSPPVIYVVPSRDMIISSNHRHVDASGKVSIPELQSWTYPQSTLLDTISTLAVICGENPPLYTRQSRPAVRQPSSTSPSASVSPNSSARNARSPSPATPTSSPLSQRGAGASNGPLSPHASHQSVGGTNVRTEGGGGGAGEGAGESGASNNRRAASPLYWPPPPPPPASPATPRVSDRPASMYDHGARRMVGSPRPRNRHGDNDSGEEENDENDDASLDELQKSALLSLSEKLDHDVAMQESKLLHDQEASADLQMVLTSRSREIDAGIESLRSERLALEERLQIFLCNVDVLERWLAREGNCEGDDDSNGDGDDSIPGGSGDGDGEARFLPKGGHVDNGQGEGARLLREGVVGAGDQHQRHYPWRRRGALSRGKVDVDNVFEAADVWSRAQLEAMAQDLAIEDLSYCLDDAVRTGIISLENYLRYTRSLAREQFFQRAMVVKAKRAMEGSTGTPVFVL